ncbi:MAG: motility protein A [Oscillospiraceae bacterium]|jgi:chemotaxis protein MotA|nr:motility protein A [Oscillospiraceae bacterium]
MEITTIIGLIFGFACVVISIFWAGADIMSYVDLPSVFCVIGGVVGSTITSFPLESLKSLLKVMSIAFKANKIDLTKDIDKLIEIANIRRREGILALEETANNTDDPFFKKGLLLIADGVDAELVRDIMEMEMDFVKERHASAQAIILQMSSYSPAFGMIGTLIGLINMLGALSDMDALGPNMAVALVTTFYGVVLANMIFTPFAKKLAAMGSDEILRSELILEGLLAMENGENPQIIRQRLESFLPHTQLAKR